MTRAKTVIFLIILISAMGGLHAQQNCDTLARAVIANISMYQKDTLYFDVIVKRNSGIWDKWANGTFQIAFDAQGYDIMPDKHAIEFISGSSELDCPPLSGGSLPTENYYITPRVFNGRFSITVSGPDMYDKAEYVPMDAADTGIRIGRFMVYTKDRSAIPNQIKWIQPYYYYQANAYKRSNDSVETVPINVTWSWANDNIEMDNGSTTAVKYLVEKAPEPEFVLDSFIAVYRGQKMISCHWGTSKEAYNSGFIIVRGEGEFGQGIVEYKDTIASFEWPGARFAAMTGLGTTPYGRGYNYEFDTVEYRDTRYCYKLLNKDFFGVLHERATSCVNVMHAVISEASASPNPFGESTMVTYVLEDDCYLTASVYDLKGKEIRKLLDPQGRPMDHLPMAKGKYQAQFQATELSSQGLYDIIFVAEPILDDFVEKSTAVVKVSYIRNLGGN